MRKVAVWSEALALGIATLLLHAAPGSCQNASVTLEAWSPSTWSSNNSSRPGEVTTSTTKVYDPATTQYRYYPSVDAYLMGVLNAELYKDTWGRNPDFEEGYKAQAVAARTMLLIFQGRNSGKQYDVWNSQDQQKDDNRQGYDGYLNHQKAVGPDSGAHNIIIKYPLSYPSSSDLKKIETLFFSNTTSMERNATRNSEEWYDTSAGKYWEYKAPLRNAANPISGEREVDSSVPGYVTSHGVGMSQYGAMYYSKMGLTYDEILRHYYHPAPPFVRAVKVLSGSSTTVQSNAVKDKFGSGAEPTRELEKSPQGLYPPATATDDLYFWIDFSEDMLESSITVQVEGASGRVNITKESRNEDNTRRWKGKIERARIPSIGPGTRRILINARHRYVDSWWLDRTPLTVSFDGSASPATYDQGEDANHTFLVKNIAPKFNNPPPPVIKGGDGKAQLTWIAPDENADGSPLADLAGYRVYYSAGRNPRLGETVEANTESAELTGLENDTSYVVCVTAIDSIGNESACSDTVAVTPRDARWVHASGGPSGSVARISDALADAPNGTTVVVGPGVYEEPDIGLGDHIVSGWAPRDIWLMSERGPSETKIITGQIEVADQCRMVGFTLQNPTGRVLNIYFDEGVLIANNIFVGSQTAIFSGGTMSPRSEEKVNRIYNNVFAGNVVGIDMWSSYAVTDIRNNLFERLTDNGRAVIFDVVCGNAFVANNNFHGYGDDTPRQNKCAVIEANSTCSPAFMELKADDLLGSDFHLEETTTCGLT